MERNGNEALKQSGLAKFIAEQQKNKNVRYRHKRFRSIFKVVSTATDYAFFSGLEAPAEKALTNDYANPGIITTGTGLLQSISVDITGNLLKPVDYSTPIGGVPYGLYKEIQRIIDTIQCQLIVSDKKVRDIALSQLIQIPFDLIPHSVVEVGTATNTYKTVGCSVVSKKYSNAEVVLNRPMKKLDQIQLIARIPTGATGFDAALNDHYIILNADCYVEDL